MTTIETEYAAFYASVLEAKKANPSDSLDRFEKPQYEMMLKWCKDTPRAILEVDTTEIIPLSVERLEMVRKDHRPVKRPLTDGRWVFITHGAEDGRIEFGGGELISLDDERLANLFPTGAEVVILACFPGARPEKVMYNGVTYFNGYSRKKEELDIAIEGNTLYAREIPECYYSFIEEWEDICYDY